MNKRIVIILSLLLILLSACGIGSAVKETRITTNTADQWNPSIWNNYIVWEDARNGGSDIYLQNMANKQQTRVTKGVKAASPYVSGNRIVWSDKRNGNWDIYMYEISTKKTTRITTNSADQQDPAVYGNMIVWTDYRNGEFNIYLQDLSTKKQTKITSDGNSYGPAIYGTKIVYSKISEDNNHPQGPDMGVFLYDIKTKKTTQLSDNIYDASSVIYDNKVLINHFMDDYTNSYIRYFPGNKAINLPDMYNGYSGMYSNKVVYSDDRNGNSDIYMAQI